MNTHKKSESNSRTTGETFDIQSLGATAKSLLKTFWPRSLRMGKGKTYNFINYRNMNDLIEELSRGHPDTILDGTHECVYMKGKRKNIVKILKKLTDDKT